MKDMETNPRTRAAEQAKSKRDVTKKKPVSNEHVKELGSRNEQRASG